MSSRRPGYLSHLISCKKSFVLWNTELSGQAALAELCVNRIRAVFGFPVGMESERRQAMGTSPRVWEATSLTQAHNQNWMEGARETPQ
jgi:hypothetical protein